MSAPAAPGLPWSLPVGEVGLDAQMHVRSPDGAIVGNVVLLVTLYIKDGTRPEVRRGIPGAYERYLRAAGDVLRWGMNPETGKKDDLAVSPLGDASTWSPSWLALYDLQFSFVGGGTEAEADTDPHRFQLVSRQEQPEELSYLHATLPMRWAERHGFAELAQLVVDLCEDVGPSHGYAGLGLVPANPDVAPLFDVARRFAGLDPDFPHLHSDYLASLDRIKGVGWMTVLDREWIERVGGERALASRMTNDITMRPFKAGSGGLVIQAGRVPLLGDTRAGDTMQPYRTVAHAIAPILNRDPIVMFAPRGGFDHNEAVAWFSRFG